MTEKEELGLDVPAENFQGENGMRADDAPKYFTYQAELSDLTGQIEWRFSPQAATRTRYGRHGNFAQVRLFCSSFSVNEEYDVVRNVEITRRDW
jgi:hypothetical protein